VVENRRKQLWSANGHYLKTQAKHNQFTTNGNFVAVSKLYSNDFSFRSEAEARKIRNGEWPQECNPI
jgi:hypothetical protein